MTLVRFAAPPATFASHAVPAGQAIVNGCAYTVSSVFQPPAPVTMDLLGMETRSSANMETPSCPESMPGEEGHIQKDSLVIIPTYNEAANLKCLVPPVLAMGAFDVLVVDDNSPDGTGRVADALASANPGRVKVLHRSSKQGLGTAYLQGFRFALRAGYAHIFQMDADLSHDPHHLRALRDALTYADVVLGSRYVRGGGSRHWPLRRRILSRVGSAYAAVVLGLPLRDVTSGFKGFSRPALETLDFNSIRSAGYGFQIEVTYRCHQQGLHIVEVPIVFEDRQVGQSKMSGRIIMEALLMVWQVRFGDMRRGRVLPWLDSSSIAR
jgi:dolichol-phosphate mannosyltransferase